MARRAQIYFVGGASASGKSTATRELALEHDVPRIELDVLYNRLDFIEDLALRQQTMQTVTETLLRELVDADADMIVEGGWMWPTVAARLVQESEGRFCAVYCGYPNVSPEARLEMLRAHPGTKHWVVGKSETEALQWLELQIKGSAECKEAAENEGLEFFDFGVPQDGSQRLLMKYRDWRSRT